MARAAARSAKGKGRKPAPAPAPEPEISSDSEELVMHGDDADSTDLESIEDAVYDIDDASGDDSEDEELEEDARYAALAKQVKTLGAKLRIQQGEEEEEGGSEDEGAKKKAVQEERWGSKRAYYDADNIDLEGSEDEEAARDEEEEALRLQQAALSGLNPEDYGVEEETEEEKEEKDGSGDEEEAAVEFVPRDLAGLSASERAAAAARAAPELAGLLSELQGSLGELRHRVGPLLREVREGQLATAEGLSYLEAKHLLLLQYCAAIVFYLLLKAEGRQVAGHPVVARLVELRAYLDKVRPIDKRLKSQLDRLLAAAGAAAAAESDGAKLAAGPRPGALVVGAGADEEAGVKALLDEAAAEDADAEEVLAAQRRGDGVYRPPRLNPVSMEIEEGRAEARAARAARHVTARAARSDLLSELARELEGAPEEIRAVAPGADTAAVVRQRHRLASREAVEEELMVRVPLSRAEVKAQRAARRAGLAGAALLDDFREDVAAVLEGPGLGTGFNRHRLGQRWGGETPGAGAVPRSGDADLPAREPLAQRRAAFDSVAAKRAQRAAAFGDDGDDHGPARVEDEFYAAVKATKDKSKRARKEAYSFPETNVPLEEPAAPGARKVSTAIERNRGLTPHRRKDIKNPRKKNRMKFDQATVRRKGQVQAVREGGAGHYGGEATGVKSHVSKSVRF